MYEFQYAVCVRFNIGFPELLFCSSYFVCTSILVLGFILTGAWYKSAHPHRPTDVSLGVGLGEF